MNLLQYGITATFRGMRRGDTGMLLGGALVTYLAWRRGHPRRRKVKKIYIDPGQAATLRITARKSEPLDLGPIRAD